MVDSASSSITVDAEPSAVMAVLADFPRYPEWAELIKSAEVLEMGPDGHARRVRFVLDAGVVRDEYVLAYDWDGDRRVSWHLVEGAAQKSQDGSYTLTPAASGTQVHYSLAVDLKMSVPGMFKRRAEKVIMDTALKGLKKRVER